MNRYDFILKLAIFALLSLPLVAGQNACAAWLNASDTFKRYKYILEELNNGTDVSSINRLKCLVPTGYSLTTNSAKAVYRQVVRGSFHPAILYHAVADGLQDALARAETEGHMTLAWPGGYLAEAALVGYQKTGQLRFLDIFVAYFNAVIARRDDKLGKLDVYHKRAMKAWGAQELGPWIAFPTPNARIVHPATLFAVLVKNKPALQAKFGKTAAAYVKIAEETIAEFDGDWRKVAGTKKNVFWYHLPYDGKSFQLLRRDPINHVHLVGNVWLNLLKLTGKAKYRTRLQNTITVFLESVMQSGNGTVYWNYFPYFAAQEKGVSSAFSNGKQPSEYMWKVSLTLPFLLRANANGFALPTYLIPAITKTLTTVNFRETQLLRNLSPLGSRFLDPAKDKQEQVNQARNVVTLVEWPKTAGEVTTLVANRPDIFPKAWVSSHGLLAYARLLPQSS